MDSIQLGKARVAGLGLAGALLLMLLSAVPRAGAASPPAAAINTSSCDKRQVTLQLSNPGSSRVQFTIEQAQTKIVRRNADGTPVTAVVKQTLPAQLVDAGKSVNLDVVNTDEPPLPSSIQLYIWANEVDAQGNKGKQLNYQDLSKDVCANQPNPVQAGAKYLVDSGMKGMTEWMMSAAQSMVDTSRNVLKAAPNGDPTQASWITASIGGGQSASRFSLMRGLAFIVMLFLLFAQFISAAFSRRYEDAVSALFVYVPMAVLLGGMGLLLVHVLVGIFDTMEVWVDAQAWSQVDAFITATKNAYDPNGLGDQSNQAGLIFFMAFLSFAGSLFVYAELWLRAVGIDLGTLFIPLAFAGLVWTSTRHWVARAAEGLLALIAAKFVILVVLTAGVASLVAQGSNVVALTNPASLVSGMLLVWVAALAPYFAARVIPFAAGHLGAAAGGAGAAANEVVHHSPTQVYQHAAQAATLGATGATHVTGSARSLVLGGQSTVASGIDRMRGGGAANGTGGSNGTGGFNGTSGANGTSASKGGSLTPVPPPEPRAENVQAPAAAPARPAEATPPPPAPAGDEW